MMSFRRKSHWMFLGEVGGKTLPPGVGATTNGPAVDEQREGALTAQGPATAKTGQREEWKATP